MQAPLNQPRSGGICFSRGRNSLLRNSLGAGFEGAQLQLRRWKSFKFVLTSRLQPARDLLF